MIFKYTLLDAFTKTPFEGAQIAVFTHADNITQQQRLQLARELNLAETVFVSRATKSSCNAALDIMTPQGPGGFSGHAAVAACFAMGDAGLVQGSDARVMLNDQEMDVILGVKNQKVQISIPVAEKYDDYVPSKPELAQIIGLDQSEIGCLEYKPAIVGCPDAYLILPVKNNSVMRSAHFNENKWQLSFVAPLAKQILLFTSEHNFNDVNFAARIIGKGVTAQDDPPIGSAAPAFGLYLSHGINDYHRSSLVQRGDENSRVSILEVNVDKKDSEVKDLRIGGQVVKVGEGYFDLAD